MTFKLEDAEDTGALKDEVRGDVAGVAKREYPRLWEHFEEVCLDVDREPEKVLVDMLVRAIDNQDVADRVLNTDVNMGKLKAGEYRKDDMREVMEMAEEFDLFSDEKSTVDRIIEKRLESVAGGPLGGIRDGNGDGGTKVKQLEREIEVLKRRLEQERSNREQQSEVEKEEVSQSADELGSKKNLDDVFDDGEGEEVEVEEVDVGPVEDAFEEGEEVETIEVVDDDSGDEDE